MHSGNYVYHDNNQELIGYLAYDDAQRDKRPAVIVAHDWSGRNDFACDKAKKLAELGYVGFALDIYGEGKTADSLEEKEALMSSYVSNRQLLRDRLRASYDTLLQLPEVDNEQIAIIGFCFGGLCALDMARSGVDLKGAVSFHGLLNQPEHLDSKVIKAKVLALHGYEDPMAPPEQVEQFCQEMTQAGVDWQVHMYGHTKHAFTNPDANNKDLGTIYDACAEQRSWQAMRNFLSEIFE